MFQKHLSPWWWQIWIALWSLLFIAIYSRYLPFSSGVEQQANVCQINHSLRQNTGSLETGPVLLDQNKWKDLSCDIMGRMNMSTVSYSQDLCCTVPTGFLASVITHIYMSAKWVNNNSVSFVNEYYIGAVKCTAWHQILQPHNTTFSYREADGIVRLASAVILQGSINTTGLYAQLQITAQNWYVGPVTRPEVGTSTLNQLNLLLFLSFLALQPD